MFRVVIVVVVAIVPGTRQPSFVVQSEQAPGIHVSEQPRRV